MDHFVFRHVSDNMKLLSKYTLCMAEALWCKSHYDFIARTWNSHFTFISVKSHLENSLDNIHFDEMMYYAKTYCISDKSSILLLTKMCMV